MNCPKEKPEKRGKMTDDPEGITKELETQTKLAEERLSKLKYLQADFDNFRKWSEKEKASIIALANENLIKDLLVILDDFDQAVPISRAGTEPAGDADDTEKNQKNSERLRVASHRVRREKIRSAFPRSNLQGVE